jgi:hypothetical protein
MEENTIEYFKHLSKDNPLKLIELIDSNTLSNAQLTFALEHLGNARIGEDGMSVLKKYAEHEYAVVREGAIIGIYYQAEEKQSWAIEFLKDRINKENGILKEIICDFVNCL